MDELEVARQLTLLNHEHFLATKPSEYVNLAWQKVNRKRESPRLLRLLEHYAALQGWPVAALLSELDASARKAKLKFFVHLARHLAALNNFFALTAILRALRSPFLTRLPKLFTSLSSSVQKQLEQLYDAYLPRADSEELESPRLRDALEACALPAVPDVNVYTAELVAVNEVNRHPPPRLRCLSS